MMFCVKYITDNLLTWLFENNSFVPIAKLKKEKQYSIVADHLGTPTEMYDEEGLRRVELDGYGKAKLYNGSSLTECPFRYQGQYEDSETGLYYNRFRYYSPEEGMYISQDPIGLAGGNPTMYGYVRDVNRAIDILGLDPFDIIPYSSKTAPNENHHGVLDVWADKNIPDYKSRASHNPTIELTKAQHDATKKEYRDWLKEKQENP